VGVPGRHVAQHWAAELLQLSAARGRSSCRMLSQDIPGL
jgi:hypothetical protein